MKAGRRQDGLAIPLALLLLVALGLLGAGLLVLAEREATTARASVAVARTRVAAQGVVAVAGDGLTRDTLPAGLLWRPAQVLGGRSHGLQFGAEVRPLGGEWTLLSGWARIGTVRPPVEAARMLWALRPLARIGATPAVLVHGGALVEAGDAVVDGSDLLSEGEGGSGTACAPYRSRLDSVFPVPWLPPSLRVDATTDSLPSLGLLGPGALRARVADRIAGTLSPQPVVDSGVCADAPDNWGSPTDPEGPCGGRRVTRYASGDITLEGGEGQGLVLVEGSLTLRGGAVLAGLVVVRDTLRLGSGARITGLVRVGGPVVLGSGSLIRGRACPALLALEAAPALSKPVVVPGGWLRPF